MSLPYIFLFPGQGSQYVKMGFEFSQNDPRVKALFDQADQLLGRKLSSLIFKGPEKELTRTDNLQPAISLVNAACLAILRDHGYQPTAVAGHSLGEYAAHYAAGVFDFPALLKLVQARGSLMKEASEASPGGMLAIIGLSQDAIYRITEEASSRGTICTANFNAPEQIVLSGEIPALAYANQAAKSAGAKRIRMLKVSGAWHSPLMASAMNKFEEELAQVNFQDAQVSVYCNVTAKPERNGAKIRRLLREQIYSPVRWSETIIRMIKDYPDAVFVEVGPGRVLKGMMLVIDRRRKVYNIENPRSLEIFLKSNVRRET